MTTVLLIEDDDFSRTLIAAFFEQTGSTVLTAATGQEGLALQRDERVDLVLLDLGLPDMHGTEVLKQIRVRSSVPVIVISSSGDIDHRLKALAAGADDYLSKPFDPRELDGRVTAVLRRTKHETQDIGDCDPLDRWFDNWRLRYSQRDLLNPAGEPIPLTAAEFNLLSAMLQAPLRVLSRDYLLDSVTRGDEPPIDRTIDVLVCRLRRKIEEDARRPRYIKTVLGFGYRFAVPVRSNARMPVAAAMRGADTAALSA